MFKEVCQTALVFLLVDRSYVHRNEEVGAVGRFLIVADVVGQAVVERADSHIGIRRQMVEFRAGCQRQADGREAQKWFQ